MTEKIKLTRKDLDFLPSQRVIRAIELLIDDANRTSELEQRIVDLETQVVDLTNRVEALENP